MKKITFSNIASALLILVGALHIITHFTSEFTGSNADQNSVLDKMKLISFSMPGGEMRTMFEIMTGYGFTWAILLICLSLIGFITRKSKSLLYLLSLSCLSASIPMFTHLIAPPGIMLIVSSALYSIAAYRLQPAHSTE